MASGMLTKQDINLGTVRFLNDVNDAVSGGQVVSLPAGIQSPQVSQTQPGDRIVLDDSTALALSDTAVGTLFGGIYEYVQTLSTATANPARGTICFVRTADLGTDTYIVTSDALPTTARPSAVRGIFINAITKGNFGWIQVAGAASVLFDSAITSALDGALVSAKISAAVASTADSDAFAAAYAALNANAVSASILGVAMGLTATSTISKVMLTRSPFGRI